MLFCAVAHDMGPWLRSASAPPHVRGDVAIFHHCDCSQKLIALEATLKARSWLSELNANGCFYKELFSLVVLSWSLYYWVMGFYYEGACHIGDCVWNSLGDLKWKGRVALSLDNCLLIFFLMDMSVNLCFVIMMFSYDGKLTQVCLFEIISRQALWKGSEKKEGERLFVQFESCLNVFHYLWMIHRCYEAGCENVSCATCTELFPTGLFIDQA